MTKRTGATAPALPPAPREPRILHWDIESTALNATFGTILCIGWKWHADPAVTVATILDGKGKKDMLDDRTVVSRFAAAFNECDYHCTWFGDRFDLPMVRSKLIKHGMQPLAPKPSLDLWRTTRRLFKAHSNRLAVWQQFLGLPHEKTPLDFDHWLRAAQGSKPDLAYIVEHCEADVRVLEDVFNRFRPWLDNEPVRGLFTGAADEGSCPSCGSTNVRRKGYKVAATRTYQQYHCLACGHWFRGVRAVDVAKVRHTA